MKVGAEIGYVVEHDFQVRLNGSAYAKPLDFCRHYFATRQDGPVHLGNGRRCHWSFVNFIKAGLNRLAEFRFDNLPDRGGFKGPDRILIFPVPDTVPAGSYPGVSR